MSDMQFRTVRKRADKSESEKATVSESVVVHDLKAKKFVNSL
jgi:hypothetical protein